MMRNLVFNGPSGQAIHDPSPFYVRQLVANPPVGFWNEGSGDGELEFDDDGEQKVSLLILPNDECGWYLKYLRRDGAHFVETWLSLWDRARLDEVTTCSDEWMASVGLFLPREAAAHAVEEFVRTGRRSDAVTWITPAEIPETGNW